jgi:hypothetical protein
MIFYMHRDYVIAINGITQHKMPVAFILTLICLQMLLATALHGGTTMKGSGTASRPTSRRLLGPEYPCISTGRQRNSIVISI